MNSGVEKSHKLEKMVMEIVQKNTKKQKKRMRK